MSFKNKDQILGSNVFPAFLFAIYNCGTNVCLEENFELNWINYVIIS